MTIDAKQSAKPTQHYTSLDDAVSILGLSRRTLYDMIGRGELRAVKVGHRTLFDLQHAITYLNALPPGPIKPLRPRYERLSPRERAARAAAAAA